MSPTSTATVYPNGYGIRESGYECQDAPETIDCLCCEGTGGHSIGAGMDADEVDCTACDGTGLLTIKGSG